MGLATDRFDYLRETMRDADRQDPDYDKQKSLYKKIRMFCTTCNTPDIVCKTSVCHFYSLKIKAISEEEGEQRRHGSQARR